MSHPVQAMLSNHRPQLPEVWHGSQATPALHIHMLGVHTRARSPAIPQVTLSYGEKLAQLLCWPVQEYRSTGVQENRSTGVQEYKSTAVSYRFC